MLLGALYPGLYVARGGLTSAFVAVPDVVGLSLAAATTALTAAGLTVGLTSGDLAGVVTDQTPDAGTLVGTGSAVALVFALPPITGRLTQVAVEVFAALAVGARTTQLAVEVFHTAPVPARTTQVVVEVFLRWPPDPAPPFERRVIRRLRRAPHVADPQAHRRIAYATFALDLQRGVGLDGVGQGTDPLVTLRVSRDGGQTWSEPVRMRAGKLGAYTTRVRARRLGQARDAVFEVTVSDPVAWSLVQAWLEVEPEQ